MSKVNYEPTFNRVLIKETEKLQGLLYVKTTEDLIDGVIVGVGGGAGVRDGQTLTHFAVGQNVRYSKAKAIEIDVEGTKYHLITDEFIVTIKH